MWQNCPEETRKAIAVEMAKMVVEEIKKNEEEEEEEELDKKIEEE
jgi:TRAP-type C4-dicarboxylate transport system substrate-binding protein